MVYAVEVTNNDGTACAATTFDLAQSVPATWTGALGAADLDLMPGASGSTTLSVTSPLDAPADAYGVGAGVSSSAGAMHTASAASTYTVAPPPLCTRAAPTIGLSGSSADAYPGGAEPEDDPAPQLARSHLSHLSARVRITR